MWCAVLPRTNVDSNQILRKEKSNEWMSWHWYFQFIRYVFSLKSMMCWHTYAINTNKSIYKFLSMHFILFFPLTPPEVCSILIITKRRRKKRQTYRLVASNKQKNCFYRRCWLMPPAGHLYTIFPHEIQHNSFFSFFAYLWYNLYTFFIILLAKQKKSIYYYFTSSIGIEQHFDWPTLCVFLWIACDLFARKAVVLRHLNTNRSQVPTV